MGRPPSSPQRSGAPSSRRASSKLGGWAPSAPHLACSSPQLRDSKPQRLRQVGAPLPRRSQALAAGTARCLLQLRPPRP
eukprot:6325294-Alexandrium_andersonii.AAC.1